jgi:hypothetical protein
MQDVVFERLDVNVAKLDADLREVYGDKVYGLSRCGKLVMIHLADGADSRLAQQIVDAHDDTVLTPAQVERAQLEAERETYLAEPIAFDITQADLVARVAWLEKEILDLRGLSK